jgi:hypothetical protein
MARKLISRLCKELILKIQNDKCAYCGADLNALNPPNFDHFNPFCAGGMLTADNLFACCAPCNRWKSSFRFQTLEELREFIAKKKGSQNCLTCGKEIPFKSRSTSLHCSYNCRYKKRQKDWYEANKERVAKRSLELDHLRRIEQAVRMESRGIPLHYMTKKMLEKHRASQQEASLNGPSGPV